MKDIKFRAWDIFGETMITNDELLVANSPYLKHSITDTKKLKIMQYTGLEDINGTDIYVGDVLTIWIQGCRQTHPYIVEDLRELYLQTKRDDSYFCIDEMEIIGNIYTHPELRK